tara:strand:- start:10773 stop:11627 length:855 start_codon:yes stop_codon:yes gene_type:complete
MLEVRFNILDSYVDKFVITESKYSHSGEKKKLNFDFSRFKEFKKKIIYLTIENEPDNLYDETKKDAAKGTINQIRENGIKRISHQRDFLLSGLDEADANDYVFYSDNDEIPKLENIDLEKNDNKIIAFKQKMFYYKFNLFCDRIDWYGTRGCKKKHLKSFSWLRDIKIKKYSKFRIDTLFSNTKYTDLKIINDGGWHFTQVKNPKDIQAKLTNSEDHFEYKESKKTLSDIEDYIKRRVISYDHQAKSSEDKLSKEFQLETTSLNKMPLYLQKNLKKYSEWFDFK